jgi:hypothetical protein
MERFHLLVTGDTGPEGNLCTSNKNQNHIGAHVACYVTTAVLCLLLFPWLGLQGSDDNEVFRWFLLLGSLNYALYLRELGVCQHLGLAFKPL